MNIRPGATEWTRRVAQVVADEHRQEEPNEKWDHSQPRIPSYRYKREPDSCHTGCDDDHFVIAAIDSQPKSPGPRTKSPDKDNHETRGSPRRPPRYSHRPKRLPKPPGENPDDEWRAYSDGLELHMFCPSAPSASSAPAELPTRTLEQRARVPPDESPGTRMPLRVTPPPRWRENDRGSLQSSEVDLGPIALTEVSAVPIEDEALRGSEGRIGLARWCASRPLAR